jgi:hypothetical protein
VCVLPKLAWEVMEKSSVNPSTFRALGPYTMKDDRIETRNFINVKENLLLYSFYVVLYRFYYYY